MHGIAQVRYTHARDDCRIPEDDRRVREVIEESHAPAQQKGCLIDVDLV